MNFLTSLLLPLTTTTTKISVESMSANACLATAKTHLKQKEVISAASAAIQAEKKGLGNTVITVGQAAKDTSVARDYYRVAAEKYKHPEAALELIKIILQQDSFPDFELILTLHRIIINPKLNVEIPEREKDNRVKLAEQYLEYSVDCCTDRAKDALLKIDADQISTEYPKAKELANKMQEKKPQNAGNPLDFRIN